MFNTTFNNISVISWQSVLLVEETGLHGENHQPVASHWQTLSHNVVSSQGLTNPLARRPGLVISTFGLAEIISCMPDGLVKIYIGY